MIIDCTRLHILKTIELYTLKGKVLWYVSYTSKKLYEKKTCSERLIVKRGSYFLSKSGISSCGTLILW